MTVGQRVSILPAAQTDAAHAGHVFQIIEVAGVGRSAFAKLKDASGQILVGWYRVGDLSPAKADLAAATMLMLAQHRVEKDQTANLRTALLDVAREHVNLAALYVENDQDDEASGHEPRHDGPSRMLARLAKAPADERGIPYGDAARQVLNERPDLAAEYALTLPLRFQRLT